MTANSARSRRKSKLEPISLAELADTPGMSGFCTFLTRTAGEAVAILDRVEREAILKSPPVAEPDVKQTPAAPDTPLATEALSKTPPVIKLAEAEGNTPPVSDSSTFESPKPGTPINKDTVGVFGAPSPSATRGQSDSLVLLETPLVLKAPLVRTSSPQIARRFQPLENARIKAAVLAQDGHTMAEQIIYSALFHAGEGPGPFLDVAVGNRWLMARTGLSERTVQLNLKSLQMKLSIEIIRRHNPDTNEPTVYRVYTFESILDRRRAAGLDLVAKKRGGGVRLVSSKAAGASHTTPVFKT